MTPATTAPAYPGTVVRSATNPQQIVGYFLTVPTFAGRTKCACYVEVGTFTDPEFVGTTNTSAAAIMKVRYEHGQREHAR